MTSSPVDRLVVSIDARRQTVLDVIHSARREITLSLFRCNDEEVFDALGAATARGVDVDVLVTSRSKGGARRRQKLWSALERTGATLHSYSDPVVKYHAKYLVADDGPAIVASLNFTRKCFTRTCDAMVVTHDPAVVAGLRRLMAADRDRQPIPSDLSPRLLLGPEQARRQLTSVIEQARSSIRILDAKISDPDLVALLRAKRASGVSVEIVSARRVLGLKSHGKLMLVDDRLLVVGSMAFSAMSLDFRREVSLVVEEPAAIAEAAQFFAAIDADRPEPRAVGDAVNVLEQ